MRRSGQFMRMGLVAAVFLPGAAFAQTTSTSSTISTSTTTSTVATTTTSTTLVHPCTGQTCAPMPPQLVLSTPSAQVQADQGGFCWLQPTEPIAGCTAVSRTTDYRAPTLVVTEGETVTVRFTSAVPLAPRQVSLADNGAVTPLIAANPTSFRVTLPPGVHPNLDLRTLWLQGDVGYTFSLDVRRAATPADPSQGRRIALTG